MPETIAAQRCPACSGDSVAGGLAVRENMFGLCERVGASVVSVDDDSTAFQFWGSEQYLRGIPLMDARSVMVKPGDASFSKRSSGAGSSRPSLSTGPVEAIRRPG